MDKNNICYTGVDSVKKGNHTQKQYLEVMKKNYKQKCSVYIKSLHLFSFQTPKNDLWSFRVDATMSHLTHFYKLLFL